MPEPGGIQPGNRAGVGGCAALRVKAFAGQNQKYGLPGEIPRARKLGQIGQIGGGYRFAGPGNAVADDDFGVRRKTGGQKFALQAA